MPHRPLVTNFIIKLPTLLWCYQLYYDPTTSEAIDIPTHWTLESPSQWVQATASSEVRREYDALSRLASALAPRFHSLIVRRRSLVLEKAETDIIRSGEVALRLQPGCADGKPLRALSVAGIDSSNQACNGD